MVAGMRLAMASQPHPISHAHMHQAGPGWGDGWASRLEVRVFDSSLVHVALVRPCVRLALGSCGALRMHPCIRRTRPCALRMRPRVAWPRPSRGTGVRAQASEVPTAVFFFSSSSCGCKIPVPVLDGPPNSPKSLQTAPTAPKQPQQPP